MNWIHVSLTGGDRGSERHRLTGTQLWSLSRVDGLSTFLSDADGVCPRLLDSSPVKVSGSLVLIVRTHSRVISTPSQSGHSRNSYLIPRQGSKALPTRTFLPVQFLLSGRVKNLSIPLTQDLSRPSTDPVCLHNLTYTRSIDPSLCRPDPGPGPGLRPGSLPL